MLPAISLTHEYRVTVSTPISYPPQQIYTESARQLLRQAFEEPSFLNGNLATPLYFMLSEDCSPRNELMFVNTADIVYHQNPGALAGFFAHMQWQLCSQTSVHYEYQASSPLDLPGCFPSDTVCMCVIHLSTSYWV